MAQALLLFPLILTSNLFAIVPSVIPFDCPIALESVARLDLVVPLQRLSATEAETVVQQLETELDSKASEVMQERHDEGKSARTAHLVVDSLSPNTEETSRAVRRVKQLKGALGDVHVRVTPVSLPSQEAIDRHLSWVEERMDKLIGLQRRPQNLRARLLRNSAFAAGMLGGGITLAVATAFNHEPLLAITGIVMAALGLRGGWNTLRLAREEQMPEPHDSVLVMRKYLDLPRDQRPKWVFGSTRFRPRTFAPPRVWDRRDWRELGQLHQAWNMDWVLGFNNGEPRLTYFFWQPAEIRRAPFRLR